MADLHQQQIIDSLLTLLQAQEGALLDKVIDGTGDDMPVEFIDTYGAVEIVEGDEENLSVDMTKTVNIFDIGLMLYAKAKLNSDLTTSDIKKNIKELRKKIYAVIMDDTTGLTSTLSFIQQTEYSGTDAPLIISGDSTYGKQLTGFTVRYSHSTQDASA